LFPRELVQLPLTGITGIQQQHFQPGEIIFNEGDIGDSVFAIQEGECEVVREVDGKTETVAVLGSASFFGEMAVLSDCCRNATVRARTAVRVLSMSKSDFNKIRETVPAFASVFSDLANRRGAPR
jgi:CRP-like cAMP-binding protein